MDELLQVRDTNGEALAQDMIDVHGIGAASVARANARAAALAGQPSLARSWIEVLGTIQRQRVIPGHRQSS